MINAYNSMLEKCFSCRHHQEALLNMTNVDILKMYNKAYA